MRAVAIGVRVTIAISLASWTTAAEAAKQHFEPTDLELEDPGMLDVDLQFGWVKGPGPHRLVAPDAEIDLGIANNVELDLDFAYGVEIGGRPVMLKHPVTDNAWLSTKLGLWSTRDDVAKTSWGLGLQAGPKLPLAEGAHGIGYEALLLLGRNIGGTHFVLNFGGLVDPGVDPFRRRPIGLELGLDLAQDLDKNGMFSMLGEIGWIHYFSADPDQLQLTYGIQFEPEPNTDFSVIGLLGVPPGGDHYGVLVGYSPKFALWN